MSKFFQASASGKIIFAGEYAVLEGAPSIVLATDKQIHVKFEERPQNLLFRCVGGEKDVDVRASIEKGEIHFSKDFAHHDFLKRLVDHLLQDGFYAKLLSRGWEITIDSTAFFDLDEKLGIGSSAAIVVAFMKVLEQVAGRDLDTKSLWQKMQDAHTMAQNKKGSGADVATALLNQTCLFKNKHGDFILEPLALPATVHVRFFWTGKGASTPALLKKLDAWRACDEQGYQLIMGQMSQQMETIVSHLEQDRMLNDLNMFTSLLRQLDERALIGIFTQEHEDLWRLAQNYHDVVYKSCGAGGGDLGMAVSLNEKSILDFSNRANSYNVSLTSMNIK